MQEVVTLDSPVLEASVRQRTRRARLRDAVAPTWHEWALAGLSSLLLIVSFPDFELWPLAWVALVPLMFAVAHRPRPLAAFGLGWATGALFFYGSCWWLTYSMIHYGGLPVPLAYALLVPVVVIVGLFPALWAAALARLCGRWGMRALWCAAPLWAASEWARLGVTGQLWNAIGYSQAFHPAIIKLPAVWGGVYAVGFLIALINSALAFALLRRTRRALLTVAAVIAALALVFFVGTLDVPESEGYAESAIVVGVQPNVSVDFKRSPAEVDALVERHLALSAHALRAWDDSGARKLADKAPIGKEEDPERLTQLRALPRVVVWPESPMNFTYTNDARFRELVAEFAREQGAAILFNSLEPAPAGGAYNAAVLVGADGRLVAQYDKIRLLPFGEYVPVPRWLPGASLLGGVVGDFTPGADYPLLPIGRDARAGVFICFESAFPDIARRFTADGADVLINIANDGYLGRTPVLRQHLANAVFRAVENRRPVLRITNTGISAYINAHGEVLDRTDSFRPDTRTWTIARAAGGQTFYTRHGDLFTAVCAAFGLLALLVSAKERAEWLPKF